MTFAGTRHLPHVTPADAGVQRLFEARKSHWIPACSGATVRKDVASLLYSHFPEPHA